MYEMYCVRFLVLLPTKEEPMGEISNIMNYYFSDSRRFADLFNAVFFQGKLVVEADDLSEASEVYCQPKIKKTKTGRRAKRGESIHDVCKRLKTGSVLRVLALENQNLIDYAMPFRCMQYDTMEYGKQLDELRRKNEREENLSTDQEKFCGIRKQDRLLPVYTLCLYHGEEKWDGPRSLADMVEFAEGEDYFRQLFNDYPLRLYCVNEAEGLDMFHTEVAQLFRALQYRGDRIGLKKLLEENSENQHLDRDTLEAMTVLLKLPSAWEKRNKFVSNIGDREEFDMCLAVREWEAEAKRIGRSQGESIKLIELVCRKIRKGKTSETIAEELEESLENVERICATVSKCGLEADAMEIYEQISK